MLDAMDWGREDFDWKCTFCSELLLLQWQVGTGLNANGSQIRLPFGKRIRLDAELATCDRNDSEQAGAEERERSRLRNRRRNS
jgi:hypothetical protein